MLPLPMALFPEMGLSPNLDEEETWGSGVEEAGGDSPAA